LKERTRGSDEDERVRRWEDEKMGRCAD